MPIRSVSSHGIEADLLSYATLASERVLLEMHRIYTMGEKPMQVMRAFVDER